MKVLSKITDAEQSMTKEDWAALEASGHSKNFTVIDPNDEPTFVPAELGKTTKKADPAKEA